MNWVRLGWVGFNKQKNSFKTEEFCNEMEILIIYQFMIGNNDWSNTRQDKKIIVHKDSFDILLKVSLVLRFINAEQVYTQFSVYLSMPVEV